MYIIKYFSLSIYTDNIAYLYIELIYSSNFDFSKLDSDEIYIKNTFLW